MARYQVVARHVIGRNLEQRKVRITTLKKSVEGIRDARKIGYNAIVKNHQVEIVIADADTKQDAKGYPVRSVEWLYSTYNPKGTIFDGVITDRKQIKGKNRFMRVLSDGSICEYE